MNTSNALDLRTRAPRSPRESLAGFVILPRVIDKARALLAGTIGLYAYGSTLDQMFFEYTGIDEDALRDFAVWHTDDEVGQWVIDFVSVPHDTDIKKQPALSTDEIALWSKVMTNFLAVDDPHRTHYIHQALEQYNLKPETTTLFDWLDADDRASFAEGK